MGAVSALLEVDAGTDEYQGGAKNKCEYDRPGHRLIGSKRRHQPAARAGTLAPESERARAVRLRTFLMSDRVVDNRADQTASVLKSPFGRRTRYDDFIGMAIL